MHEILSLAWEVGAVAAKFLCVCGIIGVVWILAIAQAPGNLPGF